MQSTQFTVYIEQERRWDIHWLYTIYPELLCARRHSRGNATESVGSGKTVSS